MICGPAILCARGSGFAFHRAARVRVQATRPRVPVSVTYTVRHGDTLAAIARLFQVSVNQIMAWNGIAPRSGISPGQKLTIHVVKRG